MIVAKDGLSLGCKCCVCPGFVINADFVLESLGGGKPFILCFILYLLSREANIAVVNVHLVAFDK